MTNFEKFVQEFSVDTGYKNQFEQFDSLKDLIKKSQIGNSLITKIDDEIKKFNAKTSIDDNDKWMLLEFIEKSIRELTELMVKDPSIFFTSDDILSHLNGYKSFLLFQKSVQKDTQVLRSLETAITTIDTVIQYVESIFKDPRKKAAYIDLFISKGKTAGGDSLFGKIKNTVTGSTTTSKAELAVKTEEMLKVLNDPQISTQEKINLLQKQQKEVFDKFETFRREYEVHIGSSKDAQAVLQGEIGTTLDMRKISDVEVSWYNIVHHIGDLFVSDNYSATGKKLKEIISKKSNRVEVANIGLNTKVGYPYGLNNLAEFFGADMKNITEEQWYNFFYQNHHLKSSDARDIAKKMSFLTGEVEKLVKGLKDELKLLSQTNVPPGTSLSLEVNGMTYGPFQTYEEKAQFIAFTLSMLEGAFNDKEWTLPVGFDTVMKVSNLPGSYVSNFLRDNIFGKDNAMQTGLFGFAFLASFAVFHLLPTAYVTYKTYRGAKNLAGGVVDKWDETGRVKSVAEQLKAKYTLLEMGDSTGGALTLDGIDQNDIMKARNYIRYENEIDGIINWINTESERIKGVEGENSSGVKKLLRVKARLENLKESVVMTFNEKLFYYELEKVVYAGWGKDFLKALWSRNIMGGINLIRGPFFIARTKQRIYKHLTGKSGTVADYSRFAKGNSLGINNIKDSDVRRVFSEEAKTAAGEKQKTLGERVKLYANFEKELDANIKDPAFASVKEKLTAIAKERIKNATDFKSLFESTDGHPSIVKLIGEVESEMSSVSGFKDDVVEALNKKLAEPKDKSSDIRKRIQEQIHTEVVGDKGDARLSKLVHKTHLLDSHKIGGESLGDIFRKIIKTGLLDSNDDRISDLKAILGSELGPKFSKLLAITDITLREDLLKRLIEEIEKSNLNGLKGIESILDIPEAYKKFKAKLENITDTEIKEKILKEVEKKGLSSGNIEPYTRDGGHIDSYLKIQEEIKSSSKLTAENIDEIDKSLKDAFGQDPIDWNKVNRTYRRGLELIEDAKAKALRVAAGEDARIRIAEIQAANGKITESPVVAPLKETGAEVKEMPASLKSITEVLDRVELELELQRLEKGIVSEETAAMRKLRKIRTSIVSDFAGGKELQYNGQPIKDINLFKGILMGEFKIGFSNPQDILQRLMLVEKDAELKSKLSAIHQDLQRTGILHLDKIEADFTNSSWMKYFVKALKHAG